MGPPSSMVAFHSADSRLKMTSASAQSRRMMIRGFKSQSSRGPTSHGEQIQMFKFKSS